jgi:hypothetical protein
MTDSKVFQMTKLCFIADEERFDAFRLFNANAFPTFLQKQCETCGIRFALCEINSKMVQNRNHQDEIGFSAVLEKNRAELEEHLPTRQDLEIFAYYESLGLLAPLSSFLHVTKAYLDVLAHLIAGAYENKHTPRTFDRATVSEREVSGGRLINTLNRNYQGKANAKKVAALLLDHSQRWITEFVEFRDSFTHHTYPKGFEGLRVRLSKTSPCFSSANFEPPKMPNGQPVVEFCSTRFQNLRILTVGVLSLIPNCDSKMLSLDEG